MKNNANYKKNIRWAQEILSKIRYTKFLSFSVCVWKDGMDVREANDKKG